MNVNEDDFQKKLDEIGKFYEDGKDALIRQQPDEIFKSLQGLRDIAAMAVKAAYQIKDN